MIIWPDRPEDQIWFTNQEIKDMKASWFALGGFVGVALTALTVYVVYLVSGHP